MSNVASACFFQSDFINFVIVVRPGSRMKYFSEDAIVPLQAQSLHLSDQSDLTVC